jgi:hypothetical protein
VYGKGLQTLERDSRQTLTTGRGMVKEQINSFAGKRDLEFWGLGVSSWLKITTPKINKSSKCETFNPLKKEFLQNFI